MEQRRRLLQGLQGQGGRWGEGGAVRHDWRGGAVEVDMGRGGACEMKASSWCDEAGQTRRLATGCAVLFSGGAGWVTTGRRGGRVAVACVACEGEEAGCD